MVDESEETVAVVSPPSCTLPLNSKRLTGQIMQQIAKQMGLLTSALLVDTRLILEGKLEEMGYEPRNMHCPTGYGRRHAYHPSRCRGELSVE